jgi:hypothetical protein
MSAQPKLLTGGGDGVAFKASGNPSGGRSFHRFFISLCEISSPETQNNRHATWIFKKSRLFSIS